MLTLMILRSPSLSGDGLSYLRLSSYLAIVLWQKRGKRLVSRIYSITNFGESLETDNGGRVVVGPPCDSLSVFHDLDS